MWVWHVILHHRSRNMGKHQTLHRRLADHVSGCLNMAVSQPPSVYVCCAWIMFGGLAIVSPHWSDTDGLRHPQAHDLQAGAPSSMLYSFTPKYSPIRTQHTSTTFSYWCRGTVLPFSSFSALPGLDHTRESSHKTLLCRKLPPDAGPQQPGWTLPSQMPPTTAQHKPTATRDLPCPRALLPP